MKHRDDIRFATTGSALRRTGRMRARHLHAGIAPVARAATALRVVVHRSLSLRRVMPLAAAPVAIAALSAGNPAMTAATLACARTVRGAPACSRRRIAHARAAPFRPSPARHRPFSSVRLTLMQDHSS
ncbi:MULTISPECIES: hypothetical protein [unclassified Burkholderia]|uniref:hypothetical protein n=1 Tax=unclassified Burkholderia TaxID=2613784 RepID=UPI001E4DE2BD|nr:MULTISPECIES: hypothetical protein [unclassified Burkholderia]UEP28793.1 hypothetical protein LMA01_05045 [Burkholderia sp. B21-007]UEP42256.1 hypothetical protein LMA02_04650 [Burkholderia sp. B21-005]